MKCFRRFLLLFSCVLLLSIVFSSIVSAEQLENGSYKVDLSFKDENSFIDYSMSFVPNNGTRERYIDDSDVAPSDTNGYKFTSVWKIERLDGAPIIEKGGKTTVLLEDCYVSLLRTSPKMTYYREPVITILIRYTDGSYEYVDIEDYFNNSGDTSISFTFTPKKHVTRIQYQLDWTVPWEGETTGHFTYYLGEYYQDNSWHLVLTQQSEEAGLLDKVVGGLSNLAEKFQSGLADLGNKLNALGDSIRELPDKIGNILSEKIKGLFVPTEESMTEYKTRMETMLNERLGAVYEVVEITFDSWDRIEVSDVQDTIEMPLTTIPLPDGQSFSFGGFDVKVVPEGFEFLTIAIKTITAILCTVYFVNGLRKRYDEVMGVEQ